MSCKVLVVEDEVLIALALEGLLYELGHQPVGIATDSRLALELGPAADVAFVDLNLVDGATGLEIGRQLARTGVTVIYMTANPMELGEGVPGTVGVIAKPLAEAELRQTIAYAEAVLRKDNSVAPPRRLKLFEPLAEPALMSSTPDRGGRSLSRPTPPR